MWCSLAGWVLHVKNRSGPVVIICWWDDFILHGLTGNPQMFEPPSTDLTTAAPLLQYSDPADPPLALSVCVSAKMLVSGVWRGDDAFIILTSLLWKLLFNMSTFCFKIIQTSLHRVDYGYAQDHLYFGPLQRHLETFDGPMANMRSEIRLYLHTF